MKINYPHYISKQVLQVNYNYSKEIVLYSILSARLMNGLTIISIKFIEEGVKLS